MTDDLVKRLRGNKGDIYQMVCMMSEAADCIEKLERLLEQRDAFIVKNNLWHDFVAGLREKKNAD
jgi:uncharacterized protein Yka (UPF0111/DUF47 family)